MEEWKYRRMEEILPRRHGGHGDGRMGEGENVEVIAEIPHLAGEEWKKFYHGGTKGTEMEERKNVTMR